MAIKHLNVHNTVVDINEIESGRDQGLRYTSFQWFAQYQCVVKLILLNNVFIEKAHKDQFD